MLPILFKRIWTERLQQNRIRRWIERIPRHIKKIIELDGGNEYREGAEDKQRRHNFDNCEEVSLESDSSGYSIAEGFTAFLRDMSDYEHSELDDIDSNDESSDSSL